MNGFVKIGEAVSVMKIAGCDLELISFHVTYRGPIIKVESKAGNIVLTLKWLAHIKKDQKWTIFESRPIEIMVPAGVKLYLGSSREVAFFRFKPWEEQGYFRACFVLSKFRLEERYVQGLSRT